MSLLKRGWGRVILGIGILLGFYAFTRLLNLTFLPIFTDEAIYIRWSQIGANDASWRFISLTDGKQPLFTWVIMALLRFVPGDPLLAGRLASVATGAVSLVGMWFLAWELFKNKRVAWISSILYLVSPFALVYDRMALYDSMVATFFIWNLYIAIRLVREVRLDLALIFGMTLGAGMLNKTSGFISVYLLPATFLLAKKKIGKWVLLVILSLVLSQVFYSVLRLSPFFHMIAQKDAVFVYPLSEWIKHPFDFLQGNLSGLFDWLRGYLTLPIFIASFAPIVAFWNKPKEKLLLYICWFAPFVGLALLGRVLFPRFIFFMTMPLLVLAAVSIDWILARVNVNLWKYAVLATLFFPSLWTDYFIITNPLHAPIPYADKGQYIDNWPAGWGVREVTAFLTTESQKGPVALYTEGTFGLLPAAIEMYFTDNKKVSIYGIWPLPEEIPDEIQESVEKMPTYLIVNQSNKAPDWPIELLAKYQKGNRTDRSLRLYRVLHPSI
ncbi:hypothetical protein A3A79_04585 [Candidatus Gottesmanbacteria bacterium RIFCSPLOWO2_01_FULL_43_11b]|uniref:Glycosyltransferase RgtA/B/C/D-like domain-containing protein n=1 Tax=Candidatus Gottesmanbacteria bacterium RIFCSPLOWO2_01_FULL_43_11b TaxID=1798392 RepID=A0A1F6AIY9_9BACT|nr:MAG: hypothetical protein A3A79_04585 [Candidatus Gottesmanbacteria bacterium RIFCSPLOWO2_01_FULL_43_11b]